MPTYDYQCEKCHKTFEFFQSMKDPVLTVCPKDLCKMKKWGKGKVKRQLGTGAGLIFKGSGFYITDYRSEGYKAAAKSDKSESPGGDSTTSGTKDVKESGSKGGETKKADAKPAPALRSQRQLQKRKTIKLCRIILRRRAI